MAGQAHECTDAAELRLKDGRRDRPVKKEAGRVATGGTARLPRGRPGARTVWHPALGAPHLTLAVGPLRFVSCRAEQKD